MSLDIQQVENLNRKAQGLNSNRQQAIGMQQAAKQAYERAVYAYEQKYGIKLDDTNLQEEYNTVRMDLETSFNELNKLVTSIENGEHIPQTTQTVVQNTEPLQQAQPQQTGAFGVPTQQPTTPFPQTQQQGNSFGTQNVGVPTGATPIQNDGEPSQYLGVSPELLAQASMDAMKQQAPQITPPPITPPPIVTPTAPTQEQATDLSEQAFTPPGWGSPAPDINQQFANINNGKPFGQ